MNTQTNLKHPWPNRPEIEGLTLHAYQGEEDLKKILIICEQLQAPIPNHWLKSQHNW